MREYAYTKLQEVPGIALRDIASEFENYIVDLNLLLALVFNAGQLQVYLSPFESTDIATACLNEFEAPPESTLYRDFAFVVRPNANLRAPFLHGDAREAMAGMSAGFSMDFYNVNPESIDIDTFFGDQIDTLNEALSLVAQYKKESSYTDYLNPYKSNYRIEIQAPNTTDETALETYRDAVYQAFTIFFDAYLASLAQVEAEDDESLIEGTKEGTSEFIQLLLEKDFAGKMGRIMFKSDFDSYFLDAFWRDGYYGEGL